MDREHIISLAKKITISKRKEILKAQREVLLHTQLKKCFESMLPDASVYITHGTDEYGKDIVLLQKSPLTMDVIAIVVKKGDISGKTLGDIEDIETRVENASKDILPRNLREIQSQVKQASTIKAEVEDIIGPLAVSKVIVLLFGKMSRQAKTRITAIETSTIIECWDLDRIVREFSQYYPEVYFDSERIDFCQSKMIHLEQKYSHASTLLSDYYIEPLVSNMEIPYSFDDINTKLMMDKKGLKLQKLTSITKNHPRIILTGDPGVGKSASLAKTVISALSSVAESLTKGNTKLPSIPVLVTAECIHRTKTAKTLLSEYFSGYDLEGKFSISALYVDGLDEIPFEDREQAISKASQYSEIYNAPLIVTSRKVDVVRNPPDGFVRFELLPFEHRQAIAFFKKLVSDKKKLGQLEQALDKLQNQVPMVPLSLRLMIELVEEAKEIPASITELYERYFDIAYGISDKEKTSTLENLFLPEVKSRFLSNMAMDEFYKNDLFEVPCQQFNEYINKYSKKYSWDRDRVKHFVHELKRAGILQIDNETVKYSHRSYLDYFVALHIHNHIEDYENIQNLISTIYFSDLWSDVAFFFCGMKRELSLKLINAILDYPESGMTEHMLKYTIGRLLQAGWHSATDVMTAGIQGAVGYRKNVSSDLEILFKSAPKEVPKLLSDRFVMLLGEFAYSSVFLRDAIVVVIDKLLENSKNGNLLSATYMLWASRRIFTPQEVRKYCVNIESSSRDSIVEIEERLRILLALNMIAEVEHIKISELQKQISRSMKKYPDILKKILPERRAGFRQG